MRNIRSIFVLVLVAGFTALLTVACGDSSSPSSPSAVSAVGGAAVTGGAVSLDAKGGNGNGANTAEVCHVKGNGSVSSLFINPSAVDGHLGHGDHLPITSYADGDGDGVGDDASATSDCEPPAGNVLVGGDDDDNDDTVYPGAPEICFDGKDNNQDGEIDEGCTFASCVEIRAADPSAGDGDYTLFVGQAFDVYCHDMAGTPTEYLTLVNTGPNTNYSHYTAGGSAGGVPGVDDVRTNYTRVRLDPATLLVDTGDKTFATSTSTGVIVNNGTVTSMPYASAMDCLAPYTQTGIGNVDLRGTPFKVASSFAVDGFSAAGTFVQTDNNQVANLTGGGSCGWVHFLPRPFLFPGGGNGAAMQLAFLP